MSKRRYSLSRERIKLICIFSLSLFISILSWSLDRALGQEKSGELGSSMTLEQIKGPAVPHPDSHADVAQQRFEERFDIKTRGAIEPNPAFRYRFYPTIAQLNPGSGYLYFARALLLDSQTSAELRKNFANESEAMTVPLDSRKKTLAGYHHVFRELERFAMCEDLSFDHRIRDLHGSEIYSMLLPEVQDARHMVRLIRFRAETQLLEGDFEGAFHSILIGFRIAEHLGKGETLIQQLVSIAAQGMMLETVMDAIQTKDCPNLYWALASIPRPLCNVRRSLEIEFSMAEKFLPVLREAESEGLTHERWQELWRTSIVEFGKLATETNTPMSSAKLLKFLAGAGDAKKRILESGYTEVRLSKMCSEQLVALDGLLVLRKAASEYQKILSLPTVAAREKAMPTQVLIDASLQNGSLGFGGAVGSLLFPATNAVVMAELRNEAFYNRLITAEAIRMHVGTHEGRPPASLKELSPVTAFPNPYSDSDFGYKVEESKEEWLVTLSIDLPENEKYGYRDLKLHFPKP